MKKIISALVIVLIVVSLLGTVDAQTRTTQPMSSQEMTQFVGGGTGCGFYGNIGCCCFEVFIFQVCFCIDFGAL